MVLALVLNCIAAVAAVRGNTLPMYPERIDRTLLFVCLWGFVVAVAWGYSTRFVTNFLNLEPPQHELGRPLVVGLAIAVMCALLKWFAAADVLALALSLVAIWALRVWKRSIRPRSGPESTTHTRHLYVWLMRGCWLAPHSAWWQTGWGARLAGAGLSRTNPFGKTPIERVLRYQTTINRQLFQAMNQLERAQRLRKGDNAPAPSACRYHTISRQSWRRRTPNDKHDPQIRKRSQEVPCFQWNSFSAQSRVLGNGSRHCHAINFTNNPVVPAYVQ